MQLPAAENLLKNTEDFNIALGNVMHLNANSLEGSTDSEYNITIQRENISM